LFVGRPTLQATLKFLAHLEIPGGRKGEGSSGNRQMIKRL